MDAERGTEPDFFVRVDDVGDGTGDLAAMSVQIASATLYDHGFFQGGVFRQSMMEGWLEGQDSAFFLESIAESITERLRAGLASLFGHLGEKSSPNFGNNQLFGHLGVHFSPNGRNKSAGRLLGHPY